MSRSKANETTQATQLIAGFQKHLATVTSLTLASVAYTPAQIEAALQLLIALRSAVAAAKSAVKAKLAAEQTQAPTLRSLMAALASYVKVTFSASPDVLADFGLAPKKAATPLTTAEKTVAVAKRASTRKARGTTSKKAKKAVKGDVVNVTLTTVTAGPVVASSAAPSAPATGGRATGGATSHTCSKRGIWWGGGGAAVTGGAPAAFSPGQWRRFRSLVPSYEPIVWACIPARDAS